MNKAESIMHKAPATKTRAAKFAVTIQRELQKEIIDVLIDKKEKLEDSIESKLDFSLEINLNKGQAPISREDAQKRLKEAITLGYELKLVIMELQIKQQLFDEYFKDQKDEKK